MFSLTVLLFVAITVLIYAVLAQKYGTRKALVAVSLGFVLMLLGVYLWDYLRVA